MMPKSEVATSHVGSDRNHDCGWKELYELEKKLVAQLLEENAALSERIRTLTENDREPGDQPDDGENNSELASAIWDEYDNVERCTECAWEIVAGECRYCGTNFAHDSGDSSENGNDESLFMKEALIRSDRCTQPRGTTPLLELDTSGSLPPGWRGTHEMYKALMERGATRLMISTFQMEFFDDKGIIAWADDTVYDSFSGPGMKVGDQWMIMLGRRIAVDKDDLGGSIFIEELLEDAICAPTWETVRLSPGSEIWVTRPIGDRPTQGKSGEDAQLSEEDENPVLNFDEYEASGSDPEDAADEIARFFAQVNGYDSSDDVSESSDDDND